MSTIINCHAIRIWYWWQYRETMQCADMVWYDMIWVPSCAVLPSLALIHSWSSHFYRGIRFSIFIWRYNVHHEITYFPVSPSIFEKKRDCQKKFIEIISLYFTTAISACLMRFCEWVVECHKFIFEGWKPIIFATMYIYLLFAFITYSKHLVNYIQWDNI